MSDCYPWYPMYAQDWLTSRKVRRLTWAQQGIYKRLLDEEWVGGPLDGDPERIAEDINAPVEDVVAVLSTCFFEAVNGWVNERLEEIRAEQLAKSEALAAAGRKGGKAKQHNKIHDLARLEPGLSLASALEQIRTEQSRTDTPPSVESANEGGKKKRKTALPSGWLPNGGHHARAKRDGLNVELEIVKFREYHEAHGNVRASWDASFYTWLTKAKEIADDRAKMGRPGRADDSATQVMLARDAQGWTERKRATEEAIARDLAKRTASPPNANEHSGPLAGLVAKVVSGAA